MFIGGVWREASDGRTIDVLNPATEQVVAQVPNASDADLDDALAAAASGFAVWRLRRLPTGPTYSIGPVGCCSNGCRRSP